MFITRGTEYTIFLFFLLNVRYTWHRIHHVKGPSLRNSGSGIPDPEFRSKLILPWNDLIMMCVPPESGNSAENPEFRKMRTGINRTGRNNAQPTRQQAKQEARERRNWRRCRSKRWICRWNRRRPRDERRRDNQSNERHERGRWRQKQQQLQLRINQQNKKMGQRCARCLSGR